jgi:hypothetical protein
MKKLTLACVLLFAIAALSQSQTITVTSPNGGENWVLGSPHNITWRSSGVTGKVNILLFNGNQRVGVIQSDVAVSAGSFSWIVGNYQGGTAAPGTNYKVQIRKPQTEILDASDRPFTISETPVPAPALTITVTSPNGGETWYTNAVHEVRWTSSGISGNVTISLKKGVAVVRSWTAENTGSSYGSYSWAQAGTDYKIRVENSNGSVFDESDRNFTIQVPAGPTPPPPGPGVQPRQTELAGVVKLPELKRLIVDPKITYATIRIIRTSAQEEAYDKKYTIELTYDFEVEDVPNADKLSIDVLAIPKSALMPSGGGDWPAEATQHHRYSEGTRSGTAIRISGRMTIVHYGLYALVGSSPGLLWLSELIKFVINIPPDYGYRDSNTDNNQVTKEIQFSVGSAKKSKTCCDCIGPFGIDGQTWNFSLRDLVPQYAWIAGSILRLNQCGDTGWTGTDLKCDRLSLVPTQGERLVSFTRRPDRASLMGTVYYRCEGLGNWYNLGEATATQGEEQCAGAQFWWEVETYFIEPSVVN